MNNILKIVLTVVITLVVAGGLFFAGSMFSSMQQRTANNLPQNVGRQGNQNQNNQQAPNDQNNPNGMMPNQRNGDGQRMGNMPPQGNRNGGRMGQREGQGFGNGDMDERFGPGNDDGRMGRGGPGGDDRRGPDDDMGPGYGMMPGGEMHPNGQNPANVTPLTTDEAKKAAQDYITALKVDGLEVSNILIFNTHAYVVVKETATGNGAFELMIDPMNKVAHPAMGITTAWNLKYGGVLQANDNGHMGMRGPKGNNPNAAATATPSATSAAPAATPANVSADMPISAEQAIKDAQTYLDTDYAGATAATTATKFYGYYTVQFSKDGKVIGQLSINGYNGQVVGRAWRDTLVEQPK